MRFTISTHNLPGRIPAAAAEREVRSAAHISDVLCYNEAVRLSRGILTRLPGFDLWATDLTSIQATPISWRAARFALTGFYGRCAYDDTRVGRWGAGPATLRAGWDSAVRLRDRETGEEVWVVVAHLAPSVTQKRPRVLDAVRSWLARRRLYRLEVANLVAMTSGMTEPVVIVGDFNATPTFPLLDPLKAAGFRIVKTKPTRRRRQIDLVLVRGLRETEARVVEGASDHRRVTVTLETRRTK